MTIKDVDDAIRECLKRIARKRREDPGISIAHLVEVLLQFERDEVAEEIMRQGQMLASMTDSPLPGWATDLSRMVRNRKLTD